MERINSDLANDLGNLLHRTLSMLERYRDGVIPEPGVQTELDGEVVQLFEETVANFREQLNSYQLNTAVATLWRFVGRMNKYVDETEPWTLAKAPEKRERLDTVLYNFFEAQRLICLLIQPIMPETAAKMWQQLGIEEPLSEQTSEALTWGLLPAGVTTQKGDPSSPA